MIIRNATVADAPHFVRIFDLAGEGLPKHLWQLSAGPDGDPYQVGLERMEAKIWAAVPNTALIAEVDGKVAGGIMTYDIGPDPEPIAPDTNPLIVPLIELENAAPLTHYVNALAVFPEYQGRGIGPALLRAVSRNEGPNGMSLILEDHNERARKIYERHGFETVVSRPIVKCEWTVPGDYYVLMTRAAA